MIYIYIYIIYVFTTEGFLELAIESWPEWDLNPRPLNSVQYNYLVTLDMCFIMLYLKIEFTYRK